MNHHAFLDIRVFPWRVKTRVMDADKLRNEATNTSATYGDGLADFFIGLGLWIFIIIAAPVIVLVLAGLLLSVELPIAAALAALLLIARFVGVIPWHVIVHDNATGEERVESTRSILTAVRMVREVNLDSKVRVRWRWW